MSTAFRVIARDVNIYKMMTSILAKKSCPLRGCDARNLASHILA